MSFRLSRFLVGLGDLGLVGLGLRVRWEHLVRALGLVGLSIAELSRRCKEKAQRGRGRPLQAALIQP